MWDQRYSEDQYAYGTEPNEFLAAYASKLKGPALCLAEGEGRNGVFLATLGLQVTGIDSSEIGLAKAQKLAQSKKVSIETIVADLSDFDLGENAYQSIVSIFAHFPRDLRRSLYARCLKALQPGGIFLLEAYTEEQLSFGTGGPKDRDMLVTLDSLKEDFQGCEIELLQRIERQVVEGTYHTGLASVAQFIARKPE